LTVNATQPTSLYDAHLMSRDALNQRLCHESLQLERANWQIRQQSQDLAMLNLQLENRVVKRTEQLEESVRELEAFSHAVAHDLRGPIATVAGFCGLLTTYEAARLSDKGLHYLERIRGSSKTMADLIDGLLSLTNLFRIDLKHEPIDLSGLAQSVLDDWHLREPKRTVRSSVQAGMHCLGDVRLLQQVMVKFDRQCLEVLQQALCCGHPRREAA
jgi:signal transduction histidine kinase